GHFFVVAGDLAFDDDAIAEGGVAHFLAGVELGFAAGAGVLFLFGGGGCFAVGAGVDAVAAVAAAAAGCSLALFPVVARPAVVVIVIGVILVIGRLAATGDGALRLAAPLPATGAL